MDLYGPLAATSASAIWYWTCRTTTDTGLLACSDDRPCEDANWQVMTCVVTGRRYQITERQPYIA
jgi:hypothetical protein